MMFSNSSSFKSPLIDHTTQQEGQKTVAKLASNIQVHVSNTVHELRILVSKLVDRGARIEVGRQKIQPFQSCKCRAIDSRAYFLYL